MSERVRVGVLYGGRSGEHEVSLRSAATVIAALDTSRFEIVPIAIGKDGRWRTGIDSLRLLDEAQRDLHPLPEHGVEVTIAPEPTRRALVPLGGGGPIVLDVIFPVLHGTYGEDGTIQGLLDLADLPYVGSGVLASAVGMDKPLMKAVLRDAGLPVCRWIVARPREESPDDIAARVHAEIGFPCFVKPANLGSSVGIVKVKAAGALAAAVAEAGSYDVKIIVEAGVDARELECAVMGNESPEASGIGEIVPSHEFYDYADKYVDGGAQVLIPAPIPAEVAEEARALAIRTFRAVDAAGLGRVDFFLERRTNRLYVNEINTMPGFTRSSLYPRLWEAAGRPIGAVVERLVDLAIARHAARASRRLSFAPPTGAPANAARRSSGGSL
ncbi:MAG TPA: D-alanine--D-alanine ligase family protein [Candidatus Eisenbacteria bacterium]|nr:D-alanine--D-alanine ligase family protein [Candidatus Eisenbacteria bacterium]